MIRAVALRPGEASPLDWSHEQVVPSGATTQGKAAHMRLCHSRMFLVQLYPREGQERVFDAPERAGPGSSAGSAAPPGGHLR